MGWLSEQRRKSENGFQRRTFQRMFPCAKSSDDLREYSERFVKVKTTSWICRCYSVFLCRCPQFNRSLLQYLTLRIMIEPSPGRHQWVLSNHIISIQSYQIHILHLQNMPKENRLNWIPWNMAWEWILNRIFRETGDSDHKCCLIWVESLTPYRGKLLTLSRMWRGGV